MALVKDRLSSVQTCPYSEDLPSLYGFDEYPIDEGNINSFDTKFGRDGVIVKNLITRQSSFPLGGPSSANSNEFALQAATHEGKEPHPLINFKAASSGSSGDSGCYDSFIQANSGSLLSFKPKEDCYSGWEGNLSDDNYHWNQGLSPKCSSEIRLVQDLNSFQTASNFSSISGTGQDTSGNWLYSEATIVADNIQEPASHEANLQKRPNTGESMQAAKKQCNSPTKKPKPKTESPSKDPQSVAAKQRRERISERLKILQELVPNGSKVDLVTMLEKAISYVKFLQLQVKVLATDEFWPAQGGKAPDISQVKEAIDAILSSQRDRNSTSSSSK